MVHPESIDSSHGKGLGSKFDTTGLNEGIGQTKESAMALAGQFSFDRNPIGIVASIVFIGSLFLTVRGGWGYETMISTNYGKISFALACVIVFLYGTGRGYDVGRLSINLRSLLCFAVSVLLLLQAGMDDLFSEVIDLVSNFLNYGSSPFDGLFINIMNVTIHSLENMITSFGFILAVISWFFMGLNSGQRKGLESFEEVWHA